jgi:WD40 repeat protein
VWDARSSAEVLTLKGHTNLVASASFSGDGSRVVTSSWDGTARVWGATPLNRIFLPQGIAPTSPVSR